MAPETASPSEKNPDFDKQSIREALVTELEDISLFEDLAADSRDESVKKVLLGIASEEKKHVGELMTLLMRADKEQIEKFDEGAKAVENIDKPTTL